MTYEELTEQRHQLELQIAKIDKPKDPGLYYIGAQSALELGRDREAEGFARILIGPELKGNSKADSKCILRIRGLKTAQG